MKTDEFNEHYEIDRKSKGVKATPKNGAAAEPVAVQTADGALYDANETYYFFDVQTQEVRQSTGLRRDGEYLSTFGLRVVAVAALRMTRDGALADGQAFFNSEIERLRERVRRYEAEKAPAARGLKAVLMSR